MRVLIAVLLIVLPLGAFAETRVLVLGDSILAWNTLRGQSIPQQLDRYRGVSVRNRAASGAVFSGNSGVLGREIRRRLPRGTWDVIILNGGANDLRNECACARCDGVLNRMISVDGRRGEIPAFLDLLGTRAPRVIWVDYYPGSIRGGPFAACTDELDLLTQRLKATAQLRRHVTYVDASDVYDPRDLTLYARDLVHPTPKGGARVAALLAQVIARTAP